MAGRKASPVSRKSLRAVGVNEVLSIRERVEAGQASTDDAELLQRLMAYYRGKFTTGELSEKSARQLGILA